MRERVLRTGAGSGLCLGELGALLFCYSVDYSGGNLGISAGDFAKREKR